MERQDWTLFSPDPLDLDKSWTSMIFFFFLRTQHSFFLVLFFQIPTLGDAEPTTMTLLVFDVGSVLSATAQLESIGYRCASGSWTMTLLF